MSLRIYTKTGDKGETSLLGGTRVTKDHLRIEAYGTVDELNSFTGLLASAIEKNPVRKTLIVIQDRLMVIGSLLAADPAKPGMKLPQLSEDNIKYLESVIDLLEKKLFPLKSFILPGGNISVSFCHIARSVCRRAERIVVKLSTESNVNPDIIKYLNRLSDFYFVLARKLAKDTGAPEIIWKPVR
ncbi:MAG: cob(I)yrinic acid a,c-diamide adenosyltransferase [Bacteroidetes bacterium]|nr:cob(I)yrinic acid a,c-diamide adenosyltransferase [Bacteroidota bacterium]